MALIYWEKSSMPIHSEKKETIFKVK